MVEPVDIACMMDRTDELEEQIDDLEDRREVVEHDLQQAEHERSQAIESIEAGNEDAIERVKDAQEQYDKIERELEAIDQERKQLTVKLRETEVTAEPADRIKRLAKIAEEALQARNELFEQLEEADKQLARQIAQLKKKDEQWQRAVKQFVETFQNLSPGLNEVELRRADSSRQQQLEQERDQLLKELEEQNVDITAALDRGYSPRGVAKTFPNPWPDTEYGWIFNEALSRS